MRTLKSAIEGISSVDFSLPSEVEVAMDELASALISRFELDENEDIYWGRTPSLFDVIEELVGMGEIPAEAEDLCLEMRDLLKQAYDGELDDDDSATMEETVEKLQKLLLEKFDLE